MSDDLAIQITEDFLEKNGYEEIYGLWYKKNISVNLVYSFPSVKIGDIRTNVKYEHELLQLEKFILWD